MTAAEDLEREDRVEFAPIDAPRAP
jgi:hypothetical protein